MKNAHNDVLQFMTVGRQKIGDIANPHVKPVTGPLGTRLEDLAQGLGIDENYLKSLGDTEDEKLAAMRIRLIIEELGELVDAVRRGDTAEVADALGDILYVTIGAAVSWGIDISAVWDEIQRANMSKFPTCPVCLGVGENMESIPCGTCEGHGRIRLLDATGKILKPRGFTPPDIGAVINRQREAGQQ